MIIICTEAIVCGQIQHGENAVIARLFTPEHGLMSGYVRGGKSRTMRPTLIASNKVMAEFRQRNIDQLNSLNAELLESRGPWLSEPLACAALEWVTRLIASTLPQDNAYPDLYLAMDALLDAICHAPSARGWSQALVRFELLTLAQLGFGLDLEKCIVTGEMENLIFVSPKSGCAVSESASIGYAHKLLPLPKFLTEDADKADWEDIFSGLHLTGHFLQKHLFAEKRHEILSARNILLERLKRVIA